MALIKCKECGNPVSGKAEKCPHCGVAVKRKTGGCAMFVALFGGIFLIGYIASLFPQRNSTLHRPSDQPSPESAQEPPIRVAHSRVVEGVSFSVIHDDSVPGAKRTIDVRLEGRVSEDALRIIAQQLKSTETEEYLRTFILYYLPGMEIDRGAWASSHFDAIGQPGLHVRILGTTKEQELFLSTAPPAVTEGRMIGKWRDSTAFPGIITFLAEDGEIYMTKVFQDGTVGRYELTARKRGRRPDIPGRIAGPLITWSSIGLVIWNTETMTVFG